MSIDTHTEHDAHGGADGGHHEPPEVVDGRQRLGIWLFIGGDIITVGAILFTYLYMRGVNVGGHWMSMWGLQGHSYAFYQNLANGPGLPAPKLIHVGTLSAGLNWLATLLAIVAAGFIWLGERGLRATKNAKAFSGMAALATIVVLVAIVVSIIQLRHIPEIFVAQNDSQGMAYTAYDSAMMIVIGSALFHLCVLAFLGLGVWIRSARGVLNGERWYQARLVRYFFVWIAISSVVLSAVTTTINVKH